MEKVQHGKSTTWKKCNMENVQHEKVQHIKVQHGKSAAWKRCNMTIEEV